MYPCSKPLSNEPVGAICHTFFILVQSIYVYILLICKVLGTTFSIMEPSNFGGPGGVWRYDTYVIWLNSWVDWGQRGGIEERDLVNIWAASHLTACFTDRDNSVISIAANVDAVLRPVTSDQNHVLISCIVLPHLLRPTITIFYKNCPLSQH